MKTFLFDLPILPEGFAFPASYRRLVENDAWPDIEPWQCLAKDMPKSLSYYGSMLQKFKEAPLVPFAIICDPSGAYNDGYVTLALFDGSAQGANPRVRIYDYGTPKKSPWDNLSYDNFEAWLEAAKEESADYKSE